MKRYLILLIAIAALSSCTYKEGPFISFRSVEKRLSGTWEVDNFMIDGEIGRAHV